jgi:hypothetical protein
MDIAIGDIVEVRNGGGRLVTARILHIHRDEFDGELVDPRSFMRMRGGPFARVSATADRITKTLYRVAR